MIGLFQKAWKSRYRWYWVGGGIAIGFTVILLIGLKYRIDLEGLHRWAEELNGTLLFVSMSLLPLIGFPVSILHAVAGAKFGSVVGLCVTATTIAINLVLAYWLGTTSLRRPLRFILERYHYQLPKVPAGEDVPVSLFMALLPGLSYTIKNYLLPLGQVGFRPFFFVCLAVHTGKSSLAIFFGDFSADVTWGKVLFLSLYGLVIMVLCQHIVRRFLARRKSGKVRGPCEKPSR